MFENIDDWWPYLLKTSGDKRAKWRPELKERLCEAQNHRCCYCGKRTEYNGVKADYPTIEHVIPFSLGGRDDPTNFVIACDDCNGKRGNKILLASRRHSPWKSGR